MTRLIYTGRPSSSSTVRNLYQMEMVQNMSISTSSSTNATTNVTTTNTTVTNKTYYRNQTLISGMSQITFDALQYAQG